ncbi:hypothetical protein BAU26_25685 [Bacillus sp. N35-10-4]|uniref:hypothetical protein n=1 Tax=Bacillus sp. N35-10-4 TaxID=1866315 RepID=UPI0008FE781B|nr:hypothetical protein [Bacillus sp. N35-10-4]OJD55657.1 hypothetical protein BAU26_25685 [Bacillus sp. N35-10-4]
MKKLLLIAVLLFTSFVSTSNIYASTTSQTTPSSDQSKCTVCENKEKGEILSGVSKEKYIQNAIEDEKVSNLLNAYKEKGYKLKVEDSQVGKSLQNVIGTTLVLSKESDKGHEYAYILYNDTTGQVNDFDEEKIEQIKNMNESETQPRTCFACIAYCAALVEIPAAFAACIAFCAGSLC